MTIIRKILITLAILIVLLLAIGFWLTRPEQAEHTVDDVSGTDPIITEEKGRMIPSVQIIDPIGWPDGAAPKPAEGLVVERFAEGLDHPRIIHTLPNGDILVALTRGPKWDGGGVEGALTRFFMKRVGSYGDSANQIILLRDGNGDGVAEERHVLLANLDSPSGIGWHEGTLYVTNHNALLAFPYALGEEKVTAEPKKLMDLAPAGNHWMRNIVINPDGTRIYVAVGSASNIGEKGIDAEEGRAMIWEYNLETNRQRAFAQGLRNPNGLDFSPWTGELWTTVNERDRMGPDMVPDYLTNVPVGAQYGWPWIYWKDKFDRRVKAPVPAYLAEYTRKPEYALGPHTAALGMVFSKAGNRMGEKFASGAFIARHGSWNRAPAAGYDVVYVAFDDRGNPTGKPAPVLTGFLTGEGDAYGRPAWVAWAGDGALLVSDDTAGIIWRVIAPDAKPAAAIAQVKGERLRPLSGLGGNAAASFGKDDYARTQPQE